MLVYESGFKAIKKQQIYLTALSLNIVSPSPNRWRGTPAEGCIDLSA